MTPSAQECQATNIAWMRGLHSHREAREEARRAAA